MTDSQLIRLHVAETIVGHLLTNNGMVLDENKNSISVFTETGKEIAIDTALRFADAQRSRLWT